MSVAYSGGAISLTEAVDMLEERTEELSKCFETVESLEAKRNRDSLSVTEVEEVSCRVSLHRQRWQCLPLITGRMFL